MSDDFIPPWLPGPRAGFAETRWSIVLSARDAGGGEAARALEDLCGAYWAPLYTFIRRRGHSPEKAQDLTQGFFARLLCGDTPFARVDRERGKFRTFLLGALGHHLADEWDKERAQKRGGGRVPVPLDGDLAESWFALHVASNAATPEQEFDRQWALALLDRARHRLRTECTAAGKAELYEAVGPDESSAGEETHAGVAARLGMTENAVRMAAFHLRRRYRDLIREEVAETTGSAADVDEEMQHLAQALR